MAKEINKLKIICMLGTAACTSFASANVDTEMQNYGWVEADNFCGGYYQPPQVPALGDNNVKITADSSEFRLNGDSFLTGSVVVNYQQQLVQANYVELKRDAASNKFTSIIARDNVSLTNASFSIEGDDLLLLLQPQIHGTVTPATYYLYDNHGRGQAQAIKFAPQQLKLKKASYTTCSPGNNTWEISASTLKLNRETGRGSVTNGLLKVKNIPVFYVPYFNFPIDKRRQSGFLYPSFGVSDRSGVEVAVPYYFNLHPSYDATLTPKILTKRGVDVNTEFRYLTANTNGLFSIAVLPDDREYRTFKEGARNNHPGIADNDPRVTRLDGTNTRLALRVLQQGNWPTGISTTVDYNYVHDDNHFVDLGNELAMASTTHLPQRAKLSFNNEWFSSSFHVLNHQVLHPFDGPVTQAPYQLLPQIRSGASFDGGLVLTDVDLEFTNFQHERNPFTSTPFTTGLRFWTRPQISTPVLNSSYFIIPTAKLDVRHYNLNLSPTDNSNNKPTSTGRIIPIVSLDSGLVFERDVELFSHSYTQTLEPRFYYLYIPFVSQSALPNFDSTRFTFNFSQLFRDNEFSGKDRLMNANQATIAVSSKLIDNHGRDKVQVGIGNVFYFANRRISACDPNVTINCLNLELPENRDSHSAIVAFADLDLIKHWSLGGSIEWNPVQSRTDKSTVNLQYLHNKKVLNFEYQYLRLDPALGNRVLTNPMALEQTSISAALPLFDKFRAIAAWNYDWVQQRSINAMAGFEYESCCSGLRVVARRYLEPSDGLVTTSNQYNFGVFVQFVLKGLASVGNNRLDSTLPIWVPGFEPFDDSRYE